MCVNWKLEGRNRLNGEQGCGGPRGYSISTYLKDRSAGRFTRNLRDRHPQVPQRTDFLERSRQISETDARRRPSGQIHRNSKVPCSQVISETDAVKHPSGQIHLERSQWPQRQTRLSIPADRRIGTEDRFTSESQRQTPAGAPAADSTWNVHDESQRQTPTGVPADRSIGTSSASSQVNLRDRRPQAPQRTDSPATKKKST